VRILVDNPVSPLVASQLRGAGHDAVHVLDYGLHDARDETIFDRAIDEDRVIVSMDTDFGALLAVRGTAKPSVVLLRRHVPRRAADQVALLLRAFASQGEALDQGAVVVLERNRARVRSLPISRPDSSA
jgi:predicted nuclease of predicted toxin-antitoxin system